MVLGCGRADCTTDTQVEQAQEAAEEAEEEAHLCLGYLCNDLAAVPQTDGPDFQDGLNGVSLFQGFGSLWP